MKSLSVKQPWCELIASGRKTLEIRTWKTNYRGPLLICASSQPNRDALARFERQGAEVPGGFSALGVAICIVELVDCRPPRVDAHGKDEADASCYIDFDAWCWVLKNPRRVEPVPIKGRLNIYEVDDALVRFLPVASAASTRASIASEV